MGFKEENAVPEDVFFLLTVSTGATETEMSTKSFKSHILEILYSGPVGIDLWGKNVRVEAKFTYNNPQKRNEKQSHM